MDELTNQSDDLELDLGLGSEPEEAEPEETEEVTEEEATPETPDTFELGIRYNGQDMTLSREQATTLAQKGMNYDKMYERLQSYENDPAMKIIRQQAEAQGMTVQQFADRLQKFQDQYSVQQIARDFKKENPDVTDEVANKYAEQAYQNQKARTESERIARESAQRQEQDTALIQEVQAFNQMYPDVKIEDLPADVIDDINSGTKLETAYLRWQTRELRNRVANNETNARNKSKNIGSASDNVGGTGEEDPFLKGLFG